jgi:hypothetical protein
MTTDAGDRSGIYTLQWTEAIDDFKGRDQKSGVTVRLNAHAQMPAQRWEIPDQGQHDWERLLI